MQGEINPCIPKGGLKAPPLNFSNPFSPSFFNLTLLKASPSQLAACRFNMAHITLKRCNRGVFYCKIDHDNNTFLMIYHKTLYNIYFFCNMKFMKDRRLNAEIEKNIDFITSREKYYNGMII